MNFTQLIDRLRVRGRSGRLAYLFWSLAVSSVVFVILLAQSFTNLDKFASTPRLDSVLGPGALVVLMVAGIVATRRLNDMGRKPRYFWIYMALFMVSMLASGDGLLSFVLGLGIPVIWLILLVHPSKPNIESDSEIEQSV